MSFSAGDDVIVEFQGHQAAGEVVAVYRSSGFVLCRIHIDPLWHYNLDYLDPEPHVCVRIDRVSPAGRKDSESAN